MYQLPRCASPQMPARLPSPALPTPAAVARDRKSTRLNSSHTEIYTLSLHDALPILTHERDTNVSAASLRQPTDAGETSFTRPAHPGGGGERSEEHTSELQSHRDLHSFPTRRSSDLNARARHECISCLAAPAHRCRRDFLHPPCPPRRRWR